jgi:hypothetical protein
MRQTRKGQNVNQVLAPSPSEAMRIHRIPDTIEEATAILSGLGSIATTVEWGRAALVYAFTVPGNGTGDNQWSVQDRTDHRASIAAFARIGIVGLSHRKTVTAYRAAWTTAIEAGAAQPIAPGDAYQEPALPWSEHYQAPETAPERRMRAASQILRDPEQFATLIEDDKVADAIADRAVQEPRIRRRVVARIHREEDAERERLAARPQPIRPANAVIAEVISAVRAFFDQRTTAASGSVTYREVIQTVRENPDAALRQPGAPTAPQGIALGRALLGMSEEARTLGEPLALTSGASDE